MERERRRGRDVEVGGKGLTRGRQSCQKYVNTCSTGDTSIPWKLWSSKYKVALLLGDGAPAHEMPDVWTGLVSLVEGPPPKIG